MKRAILWSLLCGAMVCIGVACEGSAVARKENNASDVQAPASAEIVKIYRQSVGPMRFIGKKYENKDRVNGTFGAKWCEWFNNGWFGMIEKQYAGNLSEDLKKIYEDSGYYVGMRRYKKGEPYEYWIGILMPANTPVPEGFQHIDFPKSDIGVCWVYGKEPQIYQLCGKCEATLKEKFEFVPDEKGAYWSFERYASPRFTKPDEKGNVILDICHFIKASEK